MEVAAYRNIGVNLAGDPPEWLGARRVSANFFGTVGVAPTLGRDFLPEDAGPSSAEVAILGHALWERRFGADPGVIGSVIGIDGAAATVVGVLPAGFEFGLDSPELWLPLRLSPTESRGPRTLAIVARVRTDYTAARQELGTLGSALAEAHPETNAERSYHISAMRDELFGGATLQQGSASAAAGALFVLLIACVNVANLLLARGTSRQNEIALRRALGAARVRIFRQLISEAAILALAAGVVGLFFSIVGLRGLHLIMPTGLPRADSVVFDIRALVIGVAVAVGSVFVFAVLPALRTIRESTRERLVGRGAGPGREAGRLRNSLVVIEVTLAVVLLTTTTLVLRSVNNLSTVDPGFEAEGAVVFSLNFPEARYGDETALRGVRSQIESELAAVPGVTVAGLGTGVPTRGGRSVMYQLADATGGEEPFRAFANYWSADYATALGVEFVSGRGIQRSDDLSSADIAVVNRAFARVRWPDEQPLGRTLVIDGRMVEVVGVVGDVREFGLQSSSPAAIYLPMEQWPSASAGGSTRVVLRAGLPGPTGGTAQTSEVPVEELVGAAREVVGRVDPNLALADVGTLDEFLRDSVGQFDALGKLLGTLALIALVLAGSGVYASMAYAVARRVPEIGVRMAIGADAAAVRRLVVKGAAVVAGLGTAAGLGLAFLAARGMRAFLFGVPGIDPIALLGVTTVLAGVTLLAAWVPARRAALIDPVAALRRE
jgi:putative ABC transport system permease protein